MSKPKDRPVYVVFWADEVESFTLCGVFRLKSSAIDYINKQEDPDLYWIEETELK